jgi:hypothetical protein
MGTFVYKREKNFIVEQLKQPFMSNDVFAISSLLETTFYF